MTRALVLLPLLLAGCAMGGASAQSKPIESIAFELNSWGQPIDSWEVRADGRARHAKTLRDGSPRLRNYRIERREFSVSPADFAALAAMADALPQPRPDRADCSLRATDMPYGTLRLSGAGEEETVRFDTGCQDEPYQAFVGQLRAMDALVTGWAERHAAVRVEQVGGG